MIITHKPMIGALNTFSYGVTSEGICEATLSLDAEQPSDALKTAIALGLTYSPCLLMVDTTYQEIGEVSYQIAQAPNTTNLEWCRDTLNQLEEGWTIQDNILYSPSCSSLRTKQIKQVLVQGREFATQFLPTSPPPPDTPKQVIPWKAIAYSAIGFGMGLLTCLLT